MNVPVFVYECFFVSAGCHINDVMNPKLRTLAKSSVSAGCHINDVMNRSYER